MNADIQSKNVESFGPFTIASVLGRALTDERSLLLTESPCYVARSIDNEGVTRFRVVLSHTLGRRAFMDLLYTLAPYKAHGPDRFSRVLDNWALHDRAKAGGGSESLLHQHEASLRGIWHEFSRHRELFISVLKDPSENTRVLPVVCWERDSSGRRRWSFDTDIAEPIAGLPGLTTIDAPEPPQADALLGLITIPYFLPELRKGWQSWLPLVKNGKSNYIGPASVPVVALMHRRALLNSAFVRSIEAFVAAASA